MLNELLTQLQLRGNFLSNSECNIVKLSIFATLTSHSSFLSISSMSCTMFLSCPCSIPNLPEMQDTSLALEMADNFLEKSTDSFLLFMIEDLRLADISQPSLFKDQRVICVATELLLSAPCRVTYAVIHCRDNINYHIISYFNETSLSNLVYS